MVTCLVSLEEFCLLLQHPLLSSGKNLLIKITFHMYRLQAADGKAMRISNMAIVHLNLQNLKCKVRFWVAEMGSSWDLILGEPWLKSKSAMLSFNAQSVNSRVKHALLSWHAVLPRRGGNLVMPLVPHNHFCH